METVSAINDGGLAIEFNSGEKTEWHPHGHKLPVLTVEVPPITLIDSRQNGKNEKQLKLQKTRFSGTKQVKCFAKC
jgi:hypothetical protein